MILKIGVEMNRIFVFKELYDRAYKANRKQRMYAIPENSIELIETVNGSQNCYLVVNGKEVEGTFDGLIAKLGERINV